MRVLREVVREHRQIVLLLDLAADNPLPIDDVLSRLPPSEAERVVIRATECGARPEPKGAPTDWDGCADAVGRMVDRAREAIPQDGAGYRFFVAGRAALPVFTLLGSHLSRWSMHVTVLNQRPDSTWDVIELDGAAPPEPYFNVEGLSGPPSDATGYVAVAVTSQLNVTREQMLQFGRSHGGALAGLVSANAQGKPLDSKNGPRAALQLVELMTKVKESYPNAAGVHLFVAGPATLAFMAGRAMNANVIAEAWVANFVGGVYELALVLPRRSRPERVLDQSPERAAARVAALVKLNAVVSKLQESLLADDLPVSQDSSSRARFVEKLKLLKLAPQPDGDEFELFVHEGRLALGRGLLDALAAQDDDVAERIVSLVVLHEVYHERQNLESSTYFGIGRAGFALEEVDYAADAFAAETLVRWTVRETNSDVAGTSVHVLRAVLVGIEVFDRFEQGARIERLAERRLRRYLIWHLQHVRSMTVRTLDHLAELFSQRLVAEMAPLISYLDARYEKTVSKTLPSTEIVVAVNGVLARTTPSVGYDPAQLVEALRTYKLDTVAGILKLVRDSHKPTLIPWAVR